MTPRGRIAWLFVCIAVSLAFLAIWPPIPQNEAFHQFSDHRTIAAIPNFWNVVSNLPFAIAGFLGLARLRGVTNRVMFLGVLLTAFGSAYYHLAPDDARLVWDRLPMTIIFMSFFAAVVWPDRKPPAWFVFAAVAAGAVSILWWNLTGDLRPYAVIKFGPLLYLLPFLFVAPDRRFLLAVAGLFSVAQALELLDPAGLSFLKLSGHTWKHFAAALATYAIYLWRSAA